MTTTWLRRLQSNNRDSHVNVLHPQTLSAHDLVDIEQAVSTSLDLMLENNIVQEVKQVFLDYESINDTFLFVLRGLEGFKDPQRLPTTVVEDINRLIEIWSKHHEGFIYKIGKSRNIAGNAQVSIIDYTSVFLEDTLLTTDISECEKTNAVVEYGQTLNLEKSTAEEFFGEWTCISQELSTFKEAWNGFARRYHFKPTSSSIHELDKEITDIKKQIAKLRRDIYDILMSAGIFSLASNAFLAISNICPSAWSASLEKALPNYVHSQVQKIFKKCSASVQKLEKLQTRRGEAFAKLQGPHLVDASLGRLEDLCNSVTEKLEVIGTIWGGIQSDASAVEIYLRSASDDVNPQPSNATRVKRVQLASDIYLVLSEILREYQNCTSNDLR